MRIPANIISKYITTKREATKTLHIAIKRPVTLIPGDIIILDPRNMNLIEIFKKEIFPVAYPYNDN